MTWKKAVFRLFGKLKSERSTRSHLAAANEQMALTFSRLPGRAAHDAPQKRALIRQWGGTERAMHVPMDRAQKGNQTRAGVAEWRLIRVAPPLKTRLDLSVYDKPLDMRRHEVVRLFCRLKGF